MNVKINENYRNLKENYLFSEIGARVRRYTETHPASKIIRLGIGDVTLPLPKVVVEAMGRAVLEMGEPSTFRGYAPEYGYDFLRSTIADYYKRTGVSLSMDEIFVSDGAKCDVGNIVEIFGDNPIVIPDPVYPVYVDSNLMAGRQVTLIPGNEGNGFLPMPDAVGCTGAIIYMCSPNNPTGAVYTREQLTAWVSFASRTGSLIIFDAAYEAFIHGDYPHSIYEIPGAESCAIEICSFSKTAGFTGTRCAWAVIPEALLAGDISINKLWKRRQATKFNGVSYIVQRGAEAALTEPGLRECHAAIDYYMANAALIAQLFDRKGISYTGGTSSPYIWLRCPDNMGSWEFFSYLLERAQVVGTPGEGFGDCGRGYFRLTSFGSREATQEAVERLEQLL